MNKDLCKCGSCDHWYSLREECRRKPPRVIMGSYGIFTMYPTVKSDQWCSKYSNKQPKDSS